MRIVDFFKHALADMKRSARRQHEVDKAEFAAVKAESRAHFEEHRGHNTWVKAKADTKATWDAAHASGAARGAVQEREHEVQLAYARARKEAAEARCAAAKR